MLGDDTDMVGLVLSGTVLLENVNLDDQRRILDYYETGDLLWKKCFPDNRHEVYYLITRSKCQVAFLHYKKMAEMTGSGGLLPEGFPERLLLGVGVRTVVHVDILGQRSLRQKLLAFFSYLRNQKESGSFVLPFSLTDCADYLAVDRSAMMRELGRMKEERILEMDGRSVRL